MSKEELDELKKKVQQVEEQNLEIMWEHMNWFWRIILIWGFMSFIYVMYNVGVYIKGLIA